MYCLWRDRHLPSSTPRFCYVRRNVIVLWVFLVAFCTVHAEPFCRLCQAGVRFLCGWYSVVHVRITAYMRLMNHTPTKS